VSKNNVGVIHRQAKRKFWSGQVTALCGYVAQRGEYDTAIFGFVRGQRCPDCHRIAKQQKRKG